MGDPDRIRTSHLNLIPSYSFPINYKLYLIINLHFKVRLSAESVNFLQICLCDVKIKNIQIMPTYTRGNVIIENIKVDDIHFEFDYGLCVKSKVLTTPKLYKDGFRWKSLNLTTNETINYFVNPQYSVYAPKLYNYNAYGVNKFI